MFWMKNISCIQDPQAESNLLEWFCKEVMGDFKNEEIKQLIKARPEKLIEAQNDFLETIKKPNRVLRAIDFANFVKNLKKLSKTTKTKDCLQRLNVGSNKGKKTRDKLEKEIKALEKEIKALENKINPIKKKIKDEYAELDYKSFDFDYESKITGDFAYELAKRLSADVCIYCGRSYTSTIVEYGKNVIRPTFDHYYPKSEYPLLALSFFNLIPSCYYCNSSIKGTREFNPELDVHPYMMRASDVNDKFRFTYNYRSLDKPRIRLDIDDEKIENTATFMRTEAIYQAHNDYELNDLIEKRKRYPISRISNLMNACKGYLSEAELYQMILGDEIGLPDKEELHRSLFKLKNDLAKELFPEGYKLLKK